ncbi:MAG: toll/interleukin-1 receptor domain-containing protein [Ginsengibacter sp.]
MATNIFISYRKDDSKWNTQLLYDRLSHYFSPKAIFKDFNTIKPGENYRQVIGEALKKCQVLLVIIGKNWLNSKDENGSQRLQNPEDLLRIEIETALSRNIRVIPILFDNTTMPSESLLPESLWPLALRQCLQVTETNFDYDIKHLAESIKNKHIDDDSAQPVLYKILRYRTFFMIVISTLLVAVVTGIFGIHALRFQYIAIAALSLFVTSMLVLSLLKSKMQYRLRSRLQLICISFFTVFIAALAFHIYYSQSNTFPYTGFGGKAAYYIKGNGFTHLGDSLMKAHRYMAETDILRKLLGGPGGASRLWIPASIISAKIKILFSYTAVMIFFGLFISILTELLATKYKPATQAV